MHKNEIKLELLGITDGFELWQASLVRDGETLIQLQVGGMYSRRQAMSAMDMAFDNFIIGRPLDFGWEKL